MNRRDFLRHMGGIGAGAALAQLGLLGNHAWPRLGTTRRWCAFFSPGATTATTRSSRSTPRAMLGYSAIRGTFALPQANLVPLPEAGGTLRFGLHPGLTDWQAIWNAGQMAALLNAGTLLQPLTLAQYQASTSVRPLNLFSHIDQQHQWQTAISDAASNTGWGGRIADQFAAANAASSVPTMITASGNNLFVTGQASRALAVPVSGSFGLSGTGTSGADLARTNALSQLLGVDKESLLVDAAQDIVTNALKYSVTLSPVLGANNTPAAAPFATLTSGISKQLLAIAKIIEGRALRSMRHVRYFSPRWTTSIPTSTSSLPKRTASLSSVRRSRRSTMRWWRSARTPT
jgi:uncharacterized protein (DUF1501 family)